MRDPALQRDAVVCGSTNNVVILALIGRDSAPAIARATCVVDDQRRHRATPRGLVIFVGPATVIGHAFAAEAPERIVARDRLEIGIVDQEDRDLPLQVDTLEIIPLRLGRSHPVPHEHHRCARDVDPRCCTDGGEVQVRRTDKPHALATGGDQFGGAFAQPRMDQRHLLHPRAAGSAGLQAKRLEALDEILDRFGLAWRAGVAALEGVGRQDFHRFGQLGGIGHDRGLRRTNQRQRGQGQSEFARHQRTLFT